MKLSNEVLVNSTGVLSKLNNMELNIKVSYAISKTVERISRELSVYNKEKQKLIEKYAVKDSTGETKVSEAGTVEIKKELLEDWNRDLMELLQCENEIDIHFVKIDDLFKCNCNIAPAELNLVSFMIAE